MLNRLRYLPRLLYGATVLLALSFYSGAAPASSLEGERFQHKDWEVACDNTGTCRAAGYQKEDNSEPVSILLTRNAGANAEVTGAVQVFPRDATPAGDGESETIKESNGHVELQLTVNGKSLGNIKLDPEGLMGEITETAQLDAIVSALVYGGDIRLDNEGGMSRQVSDAGGAAVLLFMDEFQQRLATPTALNRKGNQPSDKVLSPVGAPDTQAASVNDNSTRELKEGGAAMQKDELLSALLATEVTDCPLLTDAEERKHDPLLSETDIKDALEVAQLNKKKWLVTAPCWRGAYNGGYGFWVINAELPYAPQEVTTSGTSYEKGRINLYQRGRGINDCGGAQEWLWDGGRFVLVAEYSDGLCRGFLGGAWHLPTHVDKASQR